MDKAGNARQLSRLNDRDTAAAQLAPPVRLRLAAVEYLYDGSCCALLWLKTTPLVLPACRALCWGLSKAALLFKYNHSPMTLLVLLQSLQVQVQHRYKGLSARNMELLCQQHASCAHNLLLLPLLHTARCLVRSCMLLCLWLC
jgi:hypothetical protein